MKRGMKPKGKVSIKWCAEFAYAIGLIASDGCLSKNGRHIILTSNDVQQLVTFNLCLGITTRICKKYSGTGNLSFYVQFSDVLFYQFLQAVLTRPARHMPKINPQLIKAMTFLCLRPLIFTPHWNTQKA